MKTIDRERAHCSSSHSDTVGTRNRPLREVLSTWLHSRHTDTMRSTRSLYHGHRYPLEILSHAVWLYYKFGLSLRNVEDLLAKRGLVVTYETIRRWCTKFGSEYVRRLKRRQSRLGDNWFLDEVFVTSNGERHYLWGGSGRRRSAFDRIRRFGFSATSVSIVPHLKPPRPRTRMTGPDQLSQTVQTVRILWFMGLKQMRGCVATFKNQQESAWLGRPGSVLCSHFEQLVDELNLLPNIRTAHPPRL